MLYGWIECTHFETLYFVSCVLLRGASLVRMLNAAIGDAAFQSGLQSYLKKHAYQNTFSSDLWAAFAESSGQPVQEMMKEWVGKIGSVNARKSIIHLLCR